VPILGGVAKRTAQANRVAVAPSDPGAGHVTEAGAHRGRLRSRWPSFREPTACPRYAGCRPVERAAGTEREQSARNDDRVAATRARDYLERTLVTISSAPGWPRLDPVFKQDPWRACSSESWSERRRSWPRARERLSGSLRRLCRGFFAPRSNDRRCRGLFDIAGSRRSVRNRTSLTRHRQKRPGARTLITNEADVVRKFALGGPTTTSPSKRPGAFVNAVLQVANLNLPVTDRSWELGWAAGDSARLGLPSGT
jgi:hypothetical protein